MQTNRAIDHLLWTMYGCELNERFNEPTYFVCYLDIQNRTSNNKLLNLFRDAIKQLSVSHGCTRTWMIFFKSVMFMTIPVFSSTEINVKLKWCFICQQELRLLFDVFVGPSRISITSFTWSFDCDFHGVVVTVAVGVIALAECRQIFGRR